MTERLAGSQLLVNGDLIIHRAMKVVLNDVYSDDHIKEYSHQRARNFANDLTGYAQGAALYLNQRLTPLFKEDAQHLPAIRREDGTIREEAAIVCQYYCTDLASHFLAMAFTTMCKLPEEYTLKSAMDLVVDQAIKHGDDIRKTGIALAWLNLLLLTSGLTTEEEIYAKL